MRFHTTTQPTHTNPPTPHHPTRWGLFSVVRPGPPPRGDAGAQPARGSLVGWGGGDSLLSQSHVRVEGRGGEGRGGGGRGGEGRGGEGRGGEGRGGEGRGGEGRGGRECVKPWAQRQVAPVRLLFDPPSCGFLRQASKLTTQPRKIYFLGPVVSSFSFQNPKPAGVWSLFCLFSQVFFCCLCLFFWAFLCLLVSVYLFVCLLSCFFVCCSACSSVYLFFGLCNCCSACLSVFFPFFLFWLLLVCEHVLFACVCFCLFVCLSVCLSVYWFVISFYVCL